MKKIVGIDFGTTNVRIAQWDVDSEQNPTSSLIGRGGGITMPAVIAFRRQPGGNVTTDVGEDADQLPDGPDVQVIRNIKRWALGSDPYVHYQLEGRLDQQDDPWPTWWDPDSRSVRLWNKTVPVQEVIRLIVKEALIRANLDGDVTEWRAGCPVSSDLTYRKALIAALADVGCSGKIRWIAEEPVLLLALGAQIGSLQDGAYLVYDLGGGSFDCAIAEISGGHITVLSEEGLPTLGGMNVDDALKARLLYEGSDQILRVAKELVSSGSNTRAPLPGGYTLTTQDVEIALEEGRFAEKTLFAALDAYKKAKLLWKRPDEAPPIGESLGNKSVWSLNYEDMVRDIDKVLLVGGPTRSPYFRNQLDEVFGKEKIETTEELVRAAGREDINEATLTALSHGACYMHDDQYVPITVDRIPATITLRVTDGSSGDRYEAFQKLGWGNPMMSTTPMTPHKGEWVAIPSLSDRSEHKIYSYSVSIDSPDGDSLYAPISREMRLPSEGPTRPRVDRIRIILDCLGGVWGELEAGMSSPIRERVPIAQSPIWQTEIQREKMEHLYEEQKRHEENEANRLHRNLTSNPFGWQSDPG